MSPFEGSRGTAGLPKTNGMKPLTLTGLLLLLAIALAAAGAFALTTTSRSSAAATAHCITLHKSHTSVCGG